MSSQFYVDNSPKVEEALIIQDFAEYIVQQTKSLNGGRIVVRNNNAKLIRQLINGYNKATEYAQEVAGIISTIQKRVENMSVKIDFELILSKGARVEFKQNPINYLVQQYHNDANKARISYECGKPKAPIYVVGDYTIIQGEMEIDRSVTKMIQLADAKKAKIDYIVSQY